jgi:hypothetical protein
LIYLEVRNFFFQFIYPSGKDILTSKKINIKKKLRFEYPKKKKKNCRWVRSKYPFFIHPSCGKKNGYVFIYSFMFK